MTDQRTDDQRTPFAAHDACVRKHHVLLLRDARVGGEPGGRVLGDGGRGGRRGRAVAVVVAGQQLLGHFERQGLDEARVAGNLGGYEGGGRDEGRSDEGGRKYKSL